MPPNIKPAQVLDVINSFLRVIIEQVWYYSEVYPKESFDEYVFYDIQVFSCRHPQVIAYLDALSDNTLTLMKDGIISKIFLEIYHRNKRLSSVAFSFNNSLIFEQLKNDPQFYNVDNDLFDSFELIVQWKSLLFSIISDMSMKRIDLGEDIAEFKFIISTSTNDDLSSEGNWIFERSLNHSRSNSESTFGEVDVRPMKNIFLGYINLKSYIAYH
ncbi:hypothetical protein CANINC_001277 [Pichia inconspicua]|uniref:HORMA domain-containing protein n=1 Tax=Pichia inconspicua TaxID=52247 RepID=A0A4T0X4B4_9ASCO|nr:hypothetical protein CANINC_001277 [[Candida] inconspicua]